MDGLSSAASGIAVVSLAFQLADGVKRLYEFWESVQGAPSDVRSFASDLQLLSSVLADIQTSGGDPSITNLANSALESCKIKIESLTDIVKEFEPGLNSHSRRVRKWNALKAVLKRWKIEKFRLLLGEAKVTLILVRQNLSE